MFKELIKRILKKEKGKGPPAGRAGRQGKVNLILVSDKEIRRLNRKFRGKDKATDVLAFPMGEDRVLGDIAISSETARRNAKRFGIGYRAELKRLVIHGVLHLLGYKHGRKMRYAEEVYQEL